MTLAERVYSLISDVKKEEGTDASCAIRDILSEIIHICDAHGIDPDDRFDAAIEVVREENEKN